MGLDSALNRLEIHPRGSGVVGRNVILGVESRSVALSTDASPSFP